MTAKAKRGRPPKAGEREPSGRLKRISKVDREKIVQVQIEARAKAIGIWPPEPVRAWGETLDAFEARKAARQEMLRAVARAVSLPWMGCTAGRAVAGEKDVADLWQVIQTIRQRRQAYLAALEAPSEHAAIAKMGDAPPPGDETEVLVTGPVRTDDERAEHALDAWMEVEGALSPHPNGLRAVVSSVILDQPMPSLAFLLRVVKRRLDG